MVARLPWKPVEYGGNAEIPAQPLESLSKGEIPAVVIRQAYRRDDCQTLMKRLVDRELLYDPRKPVPRKFIDDAIPEGYFKEGRSRVASRAWPSATDALKRRIDIGTSLGYRGSDPEDFFAHSRSTHELFERLFTGLPDPVEVLYNSLADVSRGKRALTAREPDGRLYGPAIIRAHYGAYTYRPHFDSVRLREKRADYAVHSFEHQFAGVLVLQNSEHAGKTAQGLIHRCLWQPEVQPHLENDTFYEYAKENSIEHCQVYLDPGDLYFFNTRLIHEVPGLESEDPRVVLATFIGYSSGRDEMFIWS
jgi:hypothetical protein